MLTTFFAVFIVTMCSIGYFKISDVVKSTDQRIENLIVDSKTLKEISEKLEQQNMHFSIYNDDKNVQFSNLYFDNFYLNLIMPIRIINYDYYFLWINSFRIEGNTYVVYYSNLITTQMYELFELGLIISAAYIIGIILTTIKGSWSNKRVLLPIRDMTETVKNISAQNLNIRINVSGSKDELKELAKTFNDTMNKIESAYNKQQQFVSDASHELRTPISVIQGYANMLNRWGKNDTKVLDESIGAIVNESENMKDLVEKLLFIARNDKDTLKIQREKFSLSKLLVIIVKETKMIDSSHIINSSILNNVYINGDKNRIKQTIRIFVDNAIKYTPENGEISVDLQKENNYAVVSIRDNGIGISKNDLNHIFDRFYRSDKSRTKESGGHGLGLSIAKIIVLRHNGKIKVRSKFSEGTEFKVYFPL